MSVLISISTVTVINEWIVNKLIKSIFNDATLENNQCLDDLESSQTYCCRFCGEHCKVGERIWKNSNLKILGVCIKCCSKEFIKLWGGTDFNNNGYNSCLLLK